MVAGPYVREQLAVFDEVAEAHNFTHASAFQIRSRAIVVIQRRPARSNK